MLCNKFRTYAYSSDTCNFKRNKKRFAFKHTYYKQQTDPNRCLSYDYHQCI